MLSYWKTIPTMRKCSISFTSWITCLATSLELLSKATLIFIVDDHRIIRYDLFFRAHMLKRRNNNIIMIYKKYRNEYELRDRELGIYSVNSFTISENANIGRCPSARISRTQHPCVDAELFTPELTQHHRVQLIFIILTLMTQVRHMSHISHGPPTQDGRTKPRMSKESHLYP